MHTTCLQWERAGNLWPQCSMKFAPSPCGSLHTALPGVRRVTCSALPFLPLSSLPGPPELRTKALCVPRELRSAPRPKPGSHCVPRQSRSPFPGASTFPGLSLCILCKIPLLRINTRKKKKKAPRTLAWRRPQEQGWPLQSILGAPLGVPLPSPFPAGRSAPRAEL